MLLICREYDWFVGDLSTKAKSVSELVSFSSRELTSVARCWAASNFFSWSLIKSVNGFGRRSNFSNSGRERSSSSHCFTILALFPLAHWAWSRTYNWMAWRSETFGIHTHRKSKTSTTPSNVLEQSNFLAPRAHRFAATKRIAIVWEAAEIDWDNWLESSSLVGCS